MEIMNLESLAVRGRDREALEKYIRQMTSRFKDILSIIIYGSAVKDNYFPGSSDLNLLVVFPRFSTQELKDISPLVKGFKGRSRISSFVVGLNEIQDSTDVYPIKYLDIKRYHRVLFGEDIFDRIDINASNIRYDLERQVRNIKLRLRQMYMHSNYTSAEIRAIVVSDLSGFSYHLATLLFLNGEDPPVKKEDIIKKAGEKFGFDPSALLNIIDLKQGGNTPPLRQMQKIFDKYLEVVGVIEEIVDKLKV